MYNYRVGAETSRSGPEAAASSEKNVHEAQGKVCSGGYKDFLYRRNTRTGTAVKGTPTTHGRVETNTKTLPTFRL